jgi:hypothetical protein
MVRTRRTNEMTEMLASVKTDLPASSVPNDPDRTDVAFRAYEIYVSRGRIDGAHLDDWLQAEFELPRQS